MGTDTLVLRTVYVDFDIDGHLRDQAVRLGFSKAELFRSYLTAGMKAAKARPELLPAATEDQTPPVLRTVCLDAKLDQRLRVESFDAHVSKNSLTLRYVRLGMSLRGTGKALRP